MADPLDQIAAKYAGGGDVSSAKDPLDEIASKYTERPKMEIPSQPIKIGADAFPDTLREVLGNTDWASRNLASAGTSLTNLWEGSKQVFGQSNQDNVRNNKIIREAAPVGAVIGDIGTTALPLGLAGNSLRAAGAVGAGYGFLQPVEASGFLDAAKGKLMNSAISGGASVGGQFLANKLLGGVTNKMTGIEKKVQEKAAQVAESETASARGVAGNAAQNAYRQLEHLRELGLNRALTPEEQLVVTSLERELSEKALEKLMPAAALKQSTADAYREAMKTEADRAAKYAADKLSNEEIKQQVMARLKRYGPAAAGGVIGNMIFPGLGGSVGGAATGLVLRPAIRSMVNLSKNPAVQHGLLSAAQNSPVFTRPVLPTASVLTGYGLLGQE